ncbi:DUF4352 domain-containing protein [Streptomyces sp. NPDC004609]|uniref:DUF4352 domain-containing protein n=1 Tax=Streptomyces sp. NPDC004609 TaxID=3364704 RepID=UPI0036829798
MSHSMQQPQPPHGGPQQTPQWGGPQQDPQWGGGPSHRADPPANNSRPKTALVLGIIALIVGLIPFVFWIGGILGLIALIVGLSGRSKYGRAANPVGAILGGAGMVFAVVGAVITLQIMSDAVDELDRSVNDASSSVESDSGSLDTDGKKGKGKKGKGKGKGKGGDKGKGGGASGLAAGDTAAYDDDLKVTVSAAKAYTPSEYASGHTPGNKAYQVTVAIENAGQENFDSTLVLADARAGADGVTAEQIFDDKVGAGFDGTILPGKKSTVTYAFDAPADAKELTVEVTPGFSHDAAIWELTL